MRWMRPCLAGLDVAGGWEILSNDGFWFVRNFADAARGPVLEFSSYEWADLAAAVEAGRWPPWMVMSPDGGAEVRMPGNAPPVLRFNGDQMEAFAVSLRRRQSELLPAASRPTRRRRPMR
ncbi:hypothetical protein Afe04nite_20820 [Asanoa ferruginea]|nr:hypothetical protein Afe04nite_20820 [Asanoa ferruginea]